MTSTDPHANEEALYAAFAERLAIEQETAPRTEPRTERRVLVPAAEVERLRALAALRPESDDDLYERHRAMILGSTG